MYHPVVVGHGVDHEERERDVLVTHQRLYAPRQAGLLGRLEQMEHDVSHDEEDDGQHAPPRQPTHIIERAQKRVREHTPLAVVHAGRRANRRVRCGGEVVQNRPRLQNVADRRFGEGGEEVTAGGGRVVEHHGRTSDDAFVDAAEWRRKKPQDHDEDGDRQREARRAHETPRAAGTPLELVLHLGRDQRAIDADDAVVRHGKDDRSFFLRRPIFTFLKVTDNLAGCGALDEVVLVPEPADARRPLRPAARADHPGTGTEPRCELAHVRVLDRPRPLGSGTLIAPDDGGWLNGVVQV